MTKFLDQNRNFPIQLLEEKRIDFPKVHITVLDFFFQSNCSNTVGWFVCANMLC